MARVLRNLRIDEVSLVDEGANQYADVLLSKRSVEPNETDGGSEVNLIEICKALGLAETATAEEVVAFIAASKTANATALDEANKAVVKSNTDKVEVEAKLAEVSKALEDATAPKGTDVSALPEDIRKQLADYSELAKRVEAEKDESARVTEVAKAKDSFKHLIDPDGIGTVLHALRKSNKDAADKLEAVLKAAEAAAALAPVTKTEGTSVVDEGGDRVESIAKRLQAESNGKLSYEQAYTKALKENPNLYDGAPVVAEDK